MLQLANQANRRIVKIKSIIAIFLLIPGIGLTQSVNDGLVEFSSSDPELQQGFVWAKMQALAYVRRKGDPVGDWYEAALPNREAFCMRDVSHQLTGANVLGLQDVNKNMLTKFVRSISVSRDWCGYWEIDRQDRPAPVDYKSDTDFWYNLPANFDILDACYRQYLWTGDTTYINNPSFREFYSRTCNDYVSRWDRNGDGIMEGTLSKIPHYRGIGSYNEDQYGVTGSDLIAGQSLGYRSYAAMLSLMGRGADGRPYLEKSKKLFSEFKDSWWDEKNGTYRQFLKEDGTWVNNDPMQLFLLRWNFITHDRAKIFLETLSKQEDKIWVEAFSYYPIEVFRYADPLTACRLLKKMTSQALKRREYPEVSYAALEAYVEGLMGIKADASNNAITTLARLPGENDQATLNRLPVFDGTINIQHVGSGKSVFVNHTKRPVYWSAGFYSENPQISVNGKKQTGRILVDLNQRKYVVFKILVMPGQSFVATRS